MGVWVGWGGAGRGGVGWRGVGWGGVGEGWGGGGVGCGEALCVFFLVCVCFGCGVLGFPRSANDVGVCFDLFLIGHHFVLLHVGCFGPLFRSWAGASPEGKCTCSFLKLPFLMWGLIKRSHIHGVTITKTNKKDDLH